MRTLERKVGVTLFVGMGSAMHLCTHFIAQPALHHCYWAMWDFHWCLSFGNHSDDSTGSRGRQVAGLAQYPKQCKPCRASVRRWKVQDV
jgi:hypothetical protein